MATGVDLKMPEKGKRRKKVDESGLTNIKKEQDTVHRRLEKKLFKRYVSPKTFPCKFQLISLFFVNIVDQPLKKLRGL